MADKYSSLFSRDSLNNHVRRHQFLSDDAFTDRKLKEVAKKAQSDIMKKSFESRQVFDSIITQGMIGLENGDLKVDTKDLLTAAKLKKDFQLKEQDQSLAMAEMMWHFASGEDNRSEAYDRRIIEGQAVTDYDPSEESPSDSERRAAQSRSFYQSLAGDSSASRAD